MQDQRCGTCFYWQKPPPRMIQGQCLFFQFLAKGEDGPPWATPAMMPSAWKTASEGRNCKVWDEREADHDIAEYALPGAQALEQA